MKETDHIYDDSLTSLQTSLKGLTDEFDSPMDCHQPAKLKT